MPLVFTRLNLYCIAQKRPLPTIEQRIELARLIAGYYTNNRKEYPYALSRRPSVEPEGIFSVLCYPKKFNDKMDEMIKEYCDKLPVPVKKERKRIPLKATKIKY